MDLTNEIVSDCREYCGDSIANDASWDSSVLQYIDIALGPLNDLGCLKSFDELDASTSWEEIIDTSKANMAVWSAIKSYVQITVKMFFDPPGSYVLTAMENTKKRLLFTIEVAYEK